MWMSYANVLQCSFFRETKFANKRDSLVSFVSLGTIAWYRAGLQMRSPKALCTIFTILLTLWNSDQKNRLLIKLFCFSSDFDETWWSCSYPSVLQFHQVSSKSDEKQKSFINGPFFCSEFKSVSRIVK